MMETRKKTLPKKEEQIMAQSDLMEDDTTPELDELEVDVADLDDFGDAAIEDDLYGLSSDLDNWSEDADYYSGFGYSDRDYINGLFR